MDNVQSVSNCIFFCIVVPYKLCYSFFENVFLATSHFFISSYECYAELL
jgi:hypothetical protein